MQKINTRQNQGIFGISYLVLYNVTAHFEHNAKILFGHFQLKNTQLIHPNTLSLMHEKTPQQTKITYAVANQHLHITIRVREILNHIKMHDFSLEYVAKHLHMSDRTLKRQLAMEGTSFSILLDEMRYGHAQSLLSCTDITLKQIAEKLGYSDVANFSRAFKRWSGRRPSNWRKDPYL